VDLDASGIYYYREIFGEWHIGSNTPKTALWRSYQQYFVQGDRSVASFGVKYLVNQTEVVFFR
jgi:hypothetical protein